MNGWLATQKDVLFGHMLSSLLYRPRELPATDLEEMQDYQQEVFVREPERFFPRPPEIPDVNFGPVKATPDYICEPFSFPSAYTPLSRGFAARYATYTETHVVHGFRYRPFMGPSRATLLFLHGWTGGDYRWETRALLPWLCRRCGYTVVALVHPYHGARTPQQARFSGEYFLSSDLVRTVEACRQAVIDARLALNWLLAGGTPASGPLGVTGISLGGFVTYLLLCADDRPIFAVPMLAHGDMFDGPIESSLTKNIRRGMQAQGLSRARVRALTGPVTARQLRPRIPPERILPVNGRYDVISTADKARLLFKAWQIPEVVWLDSGHYGIVNTRMFREDLHAFVERWCS